MNRSLIDSAQARSLSENLYPLGDQIEEIGAELAAAGYGDVAQAVQHEMELLAGSTDHVLQLRRYWSEYAKERIAGLVGPMDVVAGKIPDVAAYRSTFMADLRTRAAAGEFPSLGPIKSPQIEPTVKRYVEMLPDDPAAIRINQLVKQARRSAVQKRSLPPCDEFPNTMKGARYALLIDRYLSTLAEDGFKLDSHRKSGAVFRKLTSDGKWAFVFVDDSWDEVDFGRLSVRFGVTLPKKAVLPSSLPSCVVAAFSGDDIVPGFGATRCFASESYSEFCLAADACAYLAKILYRRVDYLISEPSILR